jgi:hypothetical protein
VISGCFFFGILHVVVTTTTARMIPDSTKIARTARIYEDAILLMKQLWNNLPMYSTHISVPNPITLSITSVTTMAKSIDDYYASCKLDGVRNILLLGVTEDGADTYSIMVDRSYNMYRVSTSFIVQDSFFQGTLIDGELVHHNDQYYYVAFDIVTSRGVDYSRETYETRMGVLSGVLQDIEIIGCECITKNIVPLRDIGAWKTMLDDNVLPSDGMIFMPNTRQIQIGTHKTMYKWKQTNTLDFVLNKSHDGGTYTIAYISLDNTPKDAKKLNIHLDQGSVAGVIDDDDALPLVVEGICTLPHCGSDGEIVCSIIGRRPDKTVPNHEKTILNTLAVIRENIGIDFIVKQCSKHIAA